MKITGSFEYSRIIYVRLKVALPKSLEINDLVMECNFVLGVLSI